MRLPLREFKSFVLSIIREADLSRRQIQLSSEAGEDRYEVFLQKILDGSAFQIRSEDGTFEVVIPKTIGNGQLLRALRSKDPDDYLASFSDCNDGRGVRATSEDGREVFITNPNVIVKTEEFGGKGDGYFLERESEQAESIRRAVEQNAPVRIVIRSNSGREEAFDGIVSVKKLNNNGKADLALLDSREQPVCLLSLKWSEEPVQIHQWGGVHHLLADDEVDDFISSLRRRNNSKLKKQSFTRKIESEDIKLDAVFGCEHDEDELDCSDMEVDAVIAGKDMMIEPTDDGSLLLTASNIWLRGEIPEGEWEPTLWTVHNKSDKQRGASYGLPGTRVMVGPNDWRKNNVENI